MVITVYRAAQSPDADWVESELQALVLAYDLIVLDESQEPHDLGEQVSLPALRHNHQLVYGRENLLAYLGELENLADAWRKFQSDVCYLDDDGETC